MRCQAARLPHGERGNAAHDHPHHATGPAAHHAADPPTGPEPDSDSNPDPAHHEHTSGSGSNTPDSPAGATTNPRRGSTTFTRRPSHAGHSSTWSPCCDASVPVGCASPPASRESLSLAMPLASGQVTLRLDAVTGASLTSMSRDCLEFVSSYPANPTSVGHDLNERTGSDLATAPAPGALAAATNAQVRDLSGGIRQSSPQG
jgi:hypothetical protein